MVQFVKLRLSGFKSFVDSTELLIEPGTTAIVGPNGCGKSNLVEALRWAMGETSAKRMRGGEMDDVIFSGTASRPARNLAEVAIHLDNRGRQAPAGFNDYDELDVVRRIERERGSTYRVNGKEVRARDVQLLFADSATGAQSTAIVSQGRVGAIINAKPIDRRLLLEEAAGITGLHSRRHEAELRLRAAEANLERLDDVLGTLETQLHSLKRQARQAVRYRNIAGQLRRNEAILLHLDRQAASLARQQAKEALVAVEFQVGELTRKAAAAAAEQAEVADSVPKLREADAAAAAALQRLVLERQDLDREEQQVEEARRQAEQRHEQIEADLQRTMALQGDAREARRRLQEEREKLEHEAVNEAKAVKEAQEQRDAQARAVSEQDEILSALSQQVAADEARRTSLEHRIRELEERLHHLDRRLGDCNRQHAELAAEANLQDELTAAQRCVREAEARLESARQGAEAAEQAMTECQAAESESRQRLQEAEGTVGRLQAEANALATLLAREDSASWPPVIDSVAVTPGWEAALGAALGEDLEAPSESRAPVHWRSLGPLDPLPALPGEAQPLSAFVEAPPELHRRLSQIGVVADEATGTRLQGGLAPGQRLVTRSGALWRWDGYTARSEAPTAGAQRLAHKNRLAELREALDTAERHLATARSDHDARHAQARAAMQDEREARDAVKAAMTAVSKAQADKSRLDQQAARAEANRSSLIQTIAILQNDHADTAQALKQTRQKLEDLPDLSATRQRIADVRLDLAEQRSTLAEAEAVIRRIARESEQRKERLAAIAQEDAAWQRRCADAERHGSELEQRLTAVKEELARLAERPGAIAQRRATLVDRLEAAETARRIAGDALAEGEQRQSAADRALKASEQAVAQAREERVRAQAGLEAADRAMVNLAEKIRERLDCAPEDLLDLAQLAPDQDLPERAQVQSAVERLARERERIGPVNLRAEAEAEDLAERIAAMQTERTDLTAAIAKLRHGIASLNREGRERLLSAFEKVDRHFSELFTRLFGGGQAHLRLTEADDPLEAGLEIMASPPGKRLQVMSLLSGGEQALTALALLFAVFLTNPAPICVLDEVDAPLDDSNVDRFCSLVDELAHGLQTRFILITHHRLTMARVDRLYGVTMAERGVSQLVSVDLEGAEAIREIA